MYFFGSYGGGTHPWNRSMGTSDPSTEDGLIEVVGLTTYQLVSKLGVGTIISISSLSVFLPRFSSVGLVASAPHSHFRQKKLIMHANALPRDRFPTTKLNSIDGLFGFQPLLQAGGHGTCITQCKTARIVTSKTIPMQVDGEACKLTPSIINLSLLNKATMLSKRKGGKAPPQTALDNLKINVNIISMGDYEQHHYDKNLLAQAG